MVGKTQNSVICAVCKTSRDFERAAYGRPFDYLRCEKCSFPVAHQNPTNKSKGIDPDKVRAYKEEVEKWAFQYFEQNEYLKDKLRNKVEQESGESKSTESSPLATSLPKNVIEASKLQKVISEVQNMTESLDSSITARMHSELKAIKVQTAEILTERFSKLEEDLSAVRSLLETLNQTETDDIGRVESDGKDQEAGTDNHSVIEPSGEQRRATESVYVYNKYTTEEFVQRTAAKRAGATNKTMEVDRLAQNGEAVLETGNGNYWLFASDYPNVACLVPNRKTFRLNPNTIDSLRICFELTRDRSLHSLNFEDKNADMNSVELIYPAILDIFDKGKSLWKIRKKGVLLFP